MSAVNRNWKKAWGQTIGLGIGVAVLVFWALNTLNTVVEPEVSLGPALLTGLGVLFGGPVALAQWWILRQHVRGAGWWLLLSLTGWLAGFGLAWPLSSNLALALSEAFDRMEPLNVTIGILAGLGLGLVILGATALILIVLLPLWLLRRLPLRNDNGSLEAQGVGQVTSEK